MDRLLQNLILIAILIEKSSSSPIVKVPEHSLITSNNAVISKKERGQATINSINRSESSFHSSEMVIAKVKIYFNSTRENTQSISMIETTIDDKTVPTVGGTGAAKTTLSNASVFKIPVSTMSNTTESSNTTRYSNSTRYTQTLEHESDKPYNNHIISIYISVVVVLTSIIIFLILTIIYIKYYRKIFRNRFVKVKKSKKNKTRFKLDKN